MLPPAASRAEGVLFCMEDEGAMLQRSNSISLNVDSLIERLLSVRGKLVSAPRSEVRARRLS